MLIEIVKHTPPWVFVLFFVLLGAGYFQSRDRSMGRGQVTLLPAAMIALSLYGVLSAFGSSPFALVSWLAGTVIAVWLGSALGAPHGVVFSGEAGRFHVPGSWLPLGLMMAIFFAKYAVGVISARQSAFATEPSFIAVVSFCYGLLSGLFLARAWVIWRAGKL